MADLDHRAESWIVQHRAGWLNPVFEAVTWAGTFGAIFLVIALLLSLRRGRHSLAPFVLAAICAADGSAWLLKRLIGRVRPPLQLPGLHSLVPLPTSGSLPSGHAATAFAAATVLAFALRRGRATAALFALAGAVAYSRLYVGVHFPLDALAGAALGVVVGATTWAVARRVLGEPAPAARCRTAAAADAR